MKPDVEIYDTTLRDGSQGEGINFSVMDKLRIAERLDAFGVHYIEGGWPGSNPKDIEFFELAKRRSSSAPVWPPSARPGAKGWRWRTMNRCGCCWRRETPVVTIFGKTWLLHVKEVLRTTPEENLAMIADTVRFLKEHGKFVVYDAEHAFDGYKDDPEYALATWQAAEAAGADVVTLCDTNGGSLPGEIATHHGGGAGQAQRRHRASTRTMTSGWVWPMPWRRWRRARRMCKERSMVTGSGRAIAI